MKYIEFTPGNWEKKIEYAYSARFDVMPKFTQEADCIKNEPNTDAYFGHDNISLLTREKYSSNTTLELTCSLVGSACPVILLVKDAKEKNGALIYKEYIEVAYEFDLFDGIGVSDYITMNNLILMTYNFLMSPVGVRNFTQQASYSIDYSTNATTRQGFKRCWFRIRCTVILFHDRFCKQVFRFGFKRCCNAQ